MWTTAADHETSNNLGACPHNQNKNVLLLVLGCGLTLTHTSRETIISK